MLLNLKHAFVLGLAVLSAASPAPAVDVEAHPLEARAKIPESIECDGVEFKKQQLVDTKNQATKCFEEDRRYPSHFNNEGRDGKPIVNSKGKLDEFPLFEHGTWSQGTEPGKFRIILKDDSKKYIYAGIAKHVGGASNAFEKC